MQRPARNPFEAWGDAPSDDRTERKRHARIVAGNGRGLTNYRRFCRDLDQACREANGSLYERERADMVAVAEAPALASRKLSESRSALDGLGADARALIGSAAESDGSDTEVLWTAIEVPGYKDGEGRLCWARRILAACEQWATDARGTITLRSRGRP